MDIPIVNGWKCIVLVMRIDWMLSVFGAPFKCRCDLCNNNHWLWPAGLAGRSRYNRFLVRVQYSITDNGSLHIKLNGCIVGHKINWECINAKPSHITIFTPYWFLIGSFRQFRNGWRVRGSDDDAVVARRWGPLSMRFELNASRTAFSHLGWLVHSHYLKVTDVMNFAWRMSISYN